MFYIYGLVDPVSCEIKYVGQTNNLKLRLLTHWTDVKHSFAKTKNFKLKDEWMAHLRHNIKIKPTIIILQTITNGKNPDDAEAWWIRNLTERGCKLYNQWCIDKYLKGIPINRNPLTFENIRIRLERLGIDHNIGTKLLGLNTANDLYSTKTVPHRIKIRMNSLEHLSHTNQLQAEVDKLKNRG